MGVQYRDRKCRYCGTQFTPHRKDQVFCPGGECRNAYWKEAMSIARHMASGDETKNPAAVMLGRLGGIATARKRRDGVLRKRVNVTGRKEKIKTNLCEMIDRSDDVELWIKSGVQVNPKSYKGETLFYRRTGDLYVSMKLYRSDRDDREAGPGQDEGEEARHRSPDDPEPA